MEPFEFLGPVQIADIAVEHAVAIEEHGGARCGGIWKWHFLTAIVKRGDCKIADLFCNISCVGPSGSASYKQPDYQTGVT